MHESEKELVQKMLRAVLQSNKTGLPLHRLQGEYKSLTGDYIPFKEMGFHTLDAYLKTIPAVVRIDVNRGEVTCHAVVCKETAQIAELVARQRSSKKKSGGHVNCQMRLKYSAHVHFGKPKAVLRKPDLSPQPDRTVKRNLPIPARGKGNIWSGQPLINPSPLYPTPMYASRFTKELPMLRHQPTFSRPERVVTPPPRFQKELSQHIFQQPITDSNANHIQTSKPPLLGNFQPNLSVIQSNLRDLFSKHKDGIPMHRLPSVYRETFKHDLSNEVLKQIVNWTHICTVQRPNNQLEAVLYSTALYQQNSQKNMPQRPNQAKTNLSPGASQHSSPAKANTNTLPTDGLKEQIYELLCKYNSGLWLHALPKVFEDTFKVKLPSDMVKVSEWSDICTVDVMSQDPYKAILYAKPKECVEESQKRFSHNNAERQEMLPTNMQHLGEKEEEEVEEVDPPIATPPLVIPAEASPSVLVVELNNTEDVVIRYVAEGYSAAHERMEDEMKEFYSNSNPVKLKSLKVGQLVAVKAEEEAWLRAQITSLEDTKIKVLYVDYGFGEVVDIAKVSKLSNQFYSLPFQATKCRLAGLEAFCEDPLLVKAVEAKACGKILAVEILQRTEKPLVVLYDTSGDDDININSLCLRELWDHSLNVQLKVDSPYTNVIVSNVCSDGTLFCQVPSKGLIRLNETLQKIESHFSFMAVTSDLFVSLPFCGKLCLFPSKGKWARVEITSVHSSRTLDVQFLDSGTIASVKVSELREIPSPFLRDLISIPPQATRCCLADLPPSIGMWTPDAVLWLRNTVLHCTECSIKVVKIDERRRMVYVYLFTSKNFNDPDQSVNRKITNVELWKQQSISPSVLKGKDEASPRTAVLPKDQAKFPKKPVTDDTVPSVVLPPPLALPKSGEHLDVFVSVACHPGHFVLQPWQELHKLEVLMEEMILHYSSTEDKSMDLEKNKIYAAKMDKKWYRVLLKGILTNGLVSVYKLDYGRHELVNSRQVQPLNETFRQLPFQAVTSQLAGIKCEQWSEAASIVFRNHVENKPLVAVIQAIHESSNPWDRKVVVYLVDTSLPDTDLWIHDLMSEYLVELHA
ncbi:tudor domain-containing protein 7 [Gastrophryne carolinensis]